MTYMRDSSVVIELIRDSKGEAKVSRVVKWYRDKEGNLQYLINKTERVARLKEHPKQLQTFFTALGVPSVFYDRSTGKYHNFF